MTYAVLSCMNSESTRTTSYAQHVTFALYEIMHACVRAHLQMTSKRLPSYVPHVIVTETSQQQLEMLLVSIKCCWWKVTLLT